ncbi:hypothetical protein KKB28_02195 [bacterium]|nr:hypothetical protein [bacterium]
MKDLLTLKNLIIVLGSVVVINVAMFFILKATQPKSAVPDLLAGAEMSDSTAHTEHDSVQTVQEPLAEAIKDSQTHDKPNADSSTLASVTEATHEIVPETTQDMDTSHMDTSFTVPMDEETIAEQPEEHATRLAEAASQGDIKQFQRLSKLLQSMKPNEAAPIMVHLSDETIVAIFMRMRERSAAKIMSLLPIERSVRISRLMAYMVDQASR